MSGYPDQDRNGGGLPGEQAVLLTKPFRKPDLATALRQALDSAEARFPASRAV